MPIINANNVPFIDSDGEPNSNLRIRFSDLSASSFYASYHTNIQDFFLIQFMHLNLLHRHPITEFLSNIDQLQQLKDGKLKLILENSGHGYNYNVGEIYKNIIIKHDIHPQHIILRTESADMLEEVKVLSSHLELPEIKIEWVRGFENWYSNLCHSHITPNTLQLKEYNNKKFLSYNGLFRLHRGTLVFLLSCYGILDKGYVSYNVKNDNFDYLTKNEHVSCFKNFFKDIPEAANILEINRKNLVTIDKIHLDTFENKNTADSYAEDNHYYENTYFSVVTETSFPEKMFSPNYSRCTDVGRILSEKIFKPILNCHPFIVVSNYQTLHLLKSLGYKSFSPFIDESYDEIKDDRLRILAIIKEVKRLCELQGQELNDFLNYCNDVCQYNRQLLKDKKDFTTPLN